MARKSTAAAVPSPIKDVKIVNPVRADQYIYTQMKRIFIFILLGL